MSDSILITFLRHIRAVATGYLLCGQNLPPARRDLIKAVALSIGLHVLIVALSGGAEHSGKAFGRRVESPPPPEIKVTLVKSQGSGQKSVIPELPPPLEFPHPQPEKPPPPALHIGEHSPGEGERSTVATPLNEFPYYTVKELTKGPQVQTYVDVEFEHMDRFAGGGRVKLSIWISAEGIVDAVTVDHQTSGLPLTAEEHLRAAFMGAHFAPGEKDGKKVRSRMQVEIEYLPLNMVNPVKPIRR